MKEKTKLMLVETPSGKNILVKAGVNDPFDVIDGHLIFFNYRGFPAASFVPGSWVSVFEYSVQTTHKMDYNALDEIIDARKPSGMSHSDWRASSIRGDIALEVYQASCDKYDAYSRSKAK